MLKFNLLMVLIFISLKAHTQSKIGQIFDVANILNKSLLVGIFYTNDFFYLENTTPLINNAVRSFSLNASSFGISLGIKF